jgi:hypothetical protein
MACVKAVAEGMPGHGNGYGYPATGKALLELAATNSPFSEQALRAFARKVRDRKTDPSPTTGVVKAAGHTVQCRREGAFWVAIKTGERIPVLET